MTSNGVDEPMIDNISILPPVDGVPESKQSEVQTTPDGTCPEVTPTGGQKRTWTEKESPEPKETGNDSKELVLKMTDVADSITSRKRAKRNLCLEEDVQMVPAVGNLDPSTEITSAQLELTRNPYNWFISPEQQPENLNSNSPIYDVLAAVNNFLIPQVEQMRRDITDLHRENKKLISTLSNLGIHHSSTDKLETIPISPPVVTKLSDLEEIENKTEAKRRKRQANAEQSLDNPEPMEVDPALPMKSSRYEAVDRSKPQPQSHYGQMNNERRNRIERTRATDDLLVNLTPADIVLKEKAFSEDFKKLPLSPAQPQAANILSLVGDDLIARGYSRVVADGESIWLEVPENWLCLTSFTKRQQTKSRHYYTLNGVTIHHQLQPELGRSPRRQKLAVKIPRGEPSSRLHPGKWYLHAHQVKMASSIQGDSNWLKLRTKRLVKILRRTFRTNYHPRVLATGKRTQYMRNNRVRQRNANSANARKNKPSAWEYLKPMQPATFPKNSLANHPMPMQAPPQWLNPHYLSQSSTPAYNKH